VCPLAWSDGLTALLAPHADPDAARAAAVFIDGVLLHALIYERPLDTATLTTALTALLDLKDEHPASGFTPGGMPNSENNILIE
jgi:DNA-binding transcriptional regulator YbjK